MSTRQRFIMTDYNGRKYYGKDITTQLDYWLKHQMCTYRAPEGATRGTTALGKFNMLRKNMGPGCVFSKLEILREPRKVSPKRSKYVQTLVAVGAMTEGKKKKKKKSPSPPPMPSNGARRFTVEATNPVSTRALEIRLGAPRRSSWAEIVQRERELERMQRIPSEDLLEVPPERLQHQGVPAPVDAPSAATTPDWSHLVWDELDDIAREEE